MEEPRIVHSRGLRLAGIKGIMNLVKNETFKLWQGFMPIKNRLTDLSGSELYSVEIYPEDYFANFSPARDFEKWAAAPVTDTFKASGPFQMLEIPGGLYAVFRYRGKSSEVHKAYQDIFGEWMPKSAFEVDNRPHFAVMGEKYKNDHPDSEEELWVPIKKGSGSSQ